MAKKKQQEAQQQVQQQEEQPIRCGLLVGVYEDGSVFFKTMGSEPHLVTLDGLVKYAERYVEDMWKRVQEQGE